MAGCRKLIGNYEEMDESQALRLSSTMDIVGPKHGNQGGTGAIDVERGAIVFIFMVFE